MFPGYQFAYYLERKLFADFDKWSNSGNNFVNNQTSFSNTAVNTFCLQRLPHTPAARSPAPSPSNERSAGRQEHGALYGIDLGALNAAHAGEKLPPLLQKFCCLTFSQEPA